jgi:large subunit ribosomal protein L4
MPKFEIYNSENIKSGEIELNDSVFSAQVKDGAVYESVKSIMASRRQGTHKSKNRGEVKGSGKKPWKQKGTGRARIGSIRSPIWKGGGTVFGPVPRDYSYSIPKKAKFKALLSVLSIKAKDGSLKIIEDLEFKEPKTKDFISVAFKLGVTEALIISPKRDRNLELSARNVRGIKVLPRESLNIYDVMKYKNLVIFKSAAKAMSDELGKRTKAE